MKRLFPLLLGLTLICLSFTFEDATPDKILDDIVVESHIELCEFAPNPSGVESSQCPGMPAELTIADDCTGSCAATLLVANLAISPAIGQSYPLPTGQPPIYYEYTYDGNSVVIGPINSATYWGKSFRVGSTDYPLFEYPLPMTFDCFDICFAGNTFLFFDAKVTQANGSLYDVASYSNSDQIFYSSIFESTDPQYYIQACAETCNDCGTNKLTREETIELNSSQTFTLENQLEEDNINEVDSETNTEFSFELSPNPFTNDINIIFSSFIDNEVSVEIFDVSGKTVIKNNYNNIDKTVRIDGANFDSGLYYCRIISDNKVMTKRLVKN